jgi:uncharacterized phage protein (TIGR01671 family)
VKLRAWLIKEKLMCDVLEWYSNGRVGISIQDSGPFLKQPEEIILMQSSGRIEKNGHDLFVGDIIAILYTDWASKASDDPRSIDQYKRDISKIGTVVFDDCEFGILFHNGGIGPLRCGKHGQIERIGNIHENPEILN